MSKYSLLVIVALTTLLADQVTKYLAVSRLTTALAGRSGLVSRLSGFVSQKNLDDDPHEDEGVYRVAPAHPVLERYWHFRYVENPGAAWGLFSDLPDALRRRFFDFVSVVALAFLISMYRKLSGEQRGLQLALALVMGGALGNYLDRLLRGYVIDFVDWHWRNQPGLRWPTFNVADAAICVGVAMMLFDSLLLSRRMAMAPVETAPEPVEP
jgi:signal peptidase II